MLSIMNEIRIVVYRYVVFSVLNAFVGFNILNLLTFIGECDFLGFNYRLEELLVGCLSSCLLLCSRSYGILLYDCLFSNK